VPPSSEAIRDGKFVELTYQVTDRKSGHVLTRVEFPLGYVHGHNEILAPSVHKALEGRRAGDVIEVPIDGNRIFGPRDESLVFTDRLENVPEEYRQVGTSILMENDRGQTRSFLVTRITDETLTVDGNNPLCGREVVFTLEVLGVRDATEEETRAGGPVVAPAAIDPSLMRPV
jgi:FKBP-type peptidyl-prolyl cis-trans isomerase SlyD